MSAAGFLLPASLLVAAFFLVPVVATLGLSFTDLSSATFGDPSWIGCWRGDTPASWPSAALA